MKSTTKIHQYWDNLKNLSMPDRYLFQLEINIIKSLLDSGKLLDVGCGDGEATAVYAQNRNITATGIDFSAARLKVARHRYPQIKFFYYDLTQKKPRGKYDYIISQRFLINLVTWSQQKKVIKNLIDHLSPRGKLILCEGSLQGAKSLNQFRGKLHLKPIPIRWHNVFIDDNNLLKLGFKLIGGFGGYFLLTRGVRPYFDSQTDWHCVFNRLATKVNLPVDFSRLKVWQYEVKN